MELNLRGRRALVTGASRGIGRATALLLAGEGCDVIGAAREAKSLEAMVGAPRPVGSGAIRSVAADLSIDADRERVIGEAGQVDILVNNAGAIPPGDLHSLTDEAWRNSWELKLFGMISMCRRILPSMTARGRGVIVNIIGAAGERPDPDYIAGSTGNAALMAFTRAIGKATPARGVRVVGINPGFTLTDRARLLLWSRAGREFGDGDRWRAIETRLPFGRACAPEEIAAAVAFLASDRSAYTSGTILTIDGGYNSSN